MRNVWAVLLGTMVAFGLVSVSDGIAGTMFELPKGLDMSDTAAAKAALEAAIATAPLRAMLAMATGYFVAAFCGGFLARKIASAKGLGPSLTVGALVLAAVLANFAMLKHPVLMVVLGVLAPVPAGWLGGRAAGAGERGTRQP